MHLTCGWSVRAANAVTTPFESRDPETCESWSTLLQTRAETNFKKAVDYKQKQGFSPLLWNKSKRDTARILFDVSTLSSHKSRGAQTK